MELAKDLILQCAQCGDEKHVTLIPHVTIHLEPCMNTIEDLNPRGRRARCRSTHWLFMRLE